MPPGDSTRRKYVQYLEPFRRGEILAASRLMSIVEAGGGEAESILNALHPQVGRAYRIGVTGLTGAGKSTLLGALIHRYRRNDFSVGVVAEDPTSPFSGGAILGDRVRMLDGSGDDGVFIRSVASRGSETGLSAIAVELADVLDAFGRDIIFLETIGIGQLEYRIRYSSDTTLVVMTPDAGDDVQSLKSGLMEVGDIFVVNKSDRENAQRYADDLRSMVELRSKPDGWLPPVVATVATTGEGVDDIVAAVDVHKQYLAEDGRFENRRIEMTKQRIMLLAEERLRRDFWCDKTVTSRLQRALTDVVGGKRSPYEAACDLVGKWANKGARR